MAVDQPLSGKATIGTLTDDDKLALIDAPGSSALVRLIAATDVRTYMQNGVELTSRKGAANGYAPLGADSKVPTGNLPALASGVTSVNGRAGVVTGVQDTAAKNTSNGYAGLDGSSKVLVGNLPGSVQNATRTTTASSSAAIDFNYQQNIMLVDQDTTVTFANLQPGAKTSCVFVMGSAGYFLVNMPASNFAWDQMVGLVGAYPNDVTTIGFECREDGVTVLGFGMPLDRNGTMNPWSGLDTFSRSLLFAGSVGLNLASTVCRLTYFRARKSYLANNVTAWCTTGAVATNTHGYYSLWTVDPTTYQLTCCAVTADDPNMFNTGTANGTPVLKAFTGAYQILGARWYAFGASWSGTGVTTTPSIGSTRDSNFNAHCALPMRMTGYITQSAPPTIGQTVADASVGADGTMYYALFA